MPPSGSYEIHSEARGPHWIAWVGRAGSRQPDRSVVLVGETQEEAEAHARAWAEQSTLLADRSKPSSASTASVPDRARTLGATDGSCRSASSTCLLPSGRSPPRPAASDEPATLTNRSTSERGSTSPRLPRPVRQTPFCTVADRYSRSRARVSATYSSRLVSSRSRACASSSASD